MQVALISDMHGNRVALETVVAAMERDAPDRIVCLGDVAVMGPDPAGTMDLLGSRPVRRVDQVLAATCSIGVGLALVVGAACAGTAMGLAVRPLGVSAWPFLQVAGAAWLLFMAWGALGLLASATQRESGPAIAWTSGIMAFSFVLEYLSRIWMLIEPLRSLSLFAYYHPPEIVRTGLGISNALCLAGAALTLTIAAVVVFLLWVYVQAVILLYGVEFTAAYARLRRGRPDEVPAAPAPRTGL